MQSGSIGAQPQYTPSAKMGRADAQKNAASSEAELGLEPEVEHQVEDSLEKVTLAARFHTTADVLQTEDLGNGQVQSKMTIALVPQKDQETLEKQGVVFPEIEEVRSNQGLSADGRIELVPVDGTGNPSTINIVQSFEVDKAKLVRDADGHAPIDGYYADLVPQGGSVLDKGWFGVPEGTQVAPDGYQFKLGTSEAGAKTETKRLRLNRISDGIGNFAQSSLAGIINIPYFSAAAPLLALTTGGFAVNKGFEDLKQAQDTLGYVESREGLSKTDKIELEVGVGHKIPVSAKAEKARIETQVRTAKSKLASTGLTLAAGGASVIGYAAAGGMFGAGGVASALAGAVAATPYLAGAAMIVGSSGMVINSLHELKSLAKEKAELQQLQAKGETHVLKTIERTDPNLKRPVAIGEQQVPITERLKKIGSEQRKHRLLATAMGGGIASVVGTVGLGASAVALGSVAMAPAGMVAAAQSVSKLQELAAEKKELLKLHEGGETMVPRQLERLDGSWGEEKVPISTLLADISKKQKTQSLILTSIGSVGATLGLTIGAGLSFMPAGLLLLVPAAIGAALFPDKVKEFAQKVVGFFSGRFGEEGKARKELVKQAGLETTAAREDLINTLEPLSKQDPSLFYVPTKAEIKEAAKLGQAPRRGYFSQLNGLLDTYAQAGSRLERFQAMQDIDGLLKQAPKNAESYIPKVRERISELQMNTEAGWVAFEVAVAMKDSAVKEALADGRVSSRIGELGLPVDNLENDMRESLTLERDAKKQAERAEKIRSGDEAAISLACRDRILNAGVVYHQAENELGQELLGKLLSVAPAAAAGSEDLELVIKEINHKLGRPMLPSTDSDDKQWWLGESTVAQGEAEPLRLVDFKTVLDANHTLEHGIDLSQAYREQGSKTTDGSLAGAEQAMALAYAQLHSADPEAASKLGSAFAALNSPDEFNGLAAEDAQKKAIGLNARLEEAKLSLEGSAPEALAAWNSARLEVEGKLFESSLDKDFMAELLAEPQLTEAARRLKVSPGGVQSLLTALLRAQITGDNHALQAQMLDATSQAIDPAKEELLTLLDQAVSKVSARRLEGGNDTVVAEAALGSPESDPTVQAFLQANPVIGEVLSSETLKEVSAQFQSSPEEVRQAYLTLVQANLNPVLTAEFEGKLQAGDVATVKVFQMGSQVGQLVQAATRPSKQVVAEEVEAGMSGPVVRGVLASSGVKDLAAKLGVDSEKLMRQLLQADLQGDKTLLSSLAARAQGGDLLAKAELEMTQTLAQATLDEAFRLSSQSTSALPIEQAA